MIRKAIILSAGQGKRLSPLTTNRPKCLLPFNGRTLIEWQIYALATNGIQDVTVVTGFQAGAVDAVLLARPYEGVQVRTIFNPFFEVADNVGSCYLAREMMEQGPFMLLNGDTLFHPALLASALTQLRGAITVTVDRKARYDSDDMKVHSEGGQLLAIGKSLPEEQSNAESIGMLFFSAAGGKMFAGALEAALHDPAGLRRWYLSVIDTLAKDVPVHVADIVGQKWCEVDYPKDLTAAGALTAELRREQMAAAASESATVRSGRVV